MSLYLEFDKIVRSFSKANVRYAVVGGLAVGLHGYVRATQDMDFMVQADAFEKAGAVLSRLGYRMNPEEQEFIRAGLMLKRFFKRIPRQDELMIVDLLIPTSVKMKNVLRRSINVPFRQGTLPVVTAADLVAMKKLRGSASDKADIAFLRKHK